MHADRALKFVRFFFPSNFLPLPELLRVLTHLIGNGRVRSVAFHPDGKNIASGSDDKTIQVWNTQTGQCASSLSLDSGLWGVGCSNKKIYLLDDVTVAQCPFKKIF